MENKTIKLNEIKAKGLKWATGSGCVMYMVKVTPTDYQWWMFSQKTGVHMINNKGKYCQPFACERVLAHWDGFKQNQK